MSTHTTGHRDTGTAPLLVTVLEAARLLAISRTSVYEMLAAGQLHPIHLGRSVRISLDELHAYIDRALQ